MLGLAPDRPIPIEPEPGQILDDRVAIFPRQRVWSMSSMRSRKRPRASRAARHPPKRRANVPQMQKSRRARRKSGDDCLSHDRVLGTRLLRFARNDSQGLSLRGAERRSNLLDNCAWLPPGDSPTADRLCLPTWRVDPAGDPRDVIPLTGPSRPPLSGGKPRRLVILLHGPRRRRQRFDRLAAILGSGRARCRVHLAERAVPLRHGAYGYQWFSVQDRSPETVLAGVRAAAPLLGRLHRRGIAEARLRRERRGAGRASRKAR